MDEDLGRDDLKVVSYSILFTKPYAEATLQAAREEVVNYATTEASFGGLKLAEFFADLQRDGIPWPPAWKKQPSEEYPEVGQRITNIPAADRKYIDFIYEVRSRQAKQDPAYDEDQAETLRKTKDMLK